LVLISLTFLDTHAALFLPMESKFIIKFSKIITGGDDSLVHFFESESLNIKSDEIEFSSPILCLSSFKSSMVVGCEDNSAYLCRDIKKTNYEMIASFSLPVRSVAFNVDGSKIAVASDDMSVKIIDFKNPSIITNYAAHTKPIFSFKFSPDGKYLAAASIDGSVRIIDISNIELITIISLSSLFSPVESETACFEMSWSPDSAFLAVPNNENISIISSLNSWKSSFSLSYKSKLSYCSWSSSSRFLASVSESTLLIWDIERKSVIDNFQHEAEFTSISWHPKGNKIVVVDNLGQIILWDDPIPTSDFTSQKEVEKKNLPKRNIINDELDQVENPPHKDNDSLLSR
jgi:chromosome transmission fidelity protein 4